MIDMLLNFFACICMYLCIYMKYSRNAKRKSVGISHQVGGLAP